MHYTSSAVDRKAAPPTRIAPNHRVRLDDAENAKEMEKRQVILSEISCFILSINYLTRMLCSAVKQTADSPLPPPPLSRSRSVGQREEGQRKRDPLSFAIIVICKCLL